MSAPAVCSDRATNLMVDLLPMEIQDKHAAQIFVSHAASAGSGHSIATVLQVTCFSKVTISAESQNHRNMWLNLF